MYVFTKCLSVYLCAARERKLHKRFPPNSHQKYQLCYYRCTQARHTMVGEVSEAAGLTLSDGQRGRGPNQS